MAIRFPMRKADLDIIAALDEEVTNGNGRLSPKQIKDWVSFHERVLKAQLAPKKKKGSGISVAKAVEVLRGVLGKRLVLPASWPNAGPLWFIPLQNRINASGLTAAHIEAAGKVAAAQWRGGVKAESIIRQTDMLLSDANMEKLGLSLPEPAEDMVDL